MKNGKKISYLLNEVEQLAGKQWDIQGLYRDINQKIRELNENSSENYNDLPKFKELSDTNKTYLCLLLLDKSAADVHNLVEGKIREDGINTAFSRIYEILNHTLLCDDKIENRRDVIVHLLKTNKYYVQNNGASSGWIWIGAVTQPTKRLPPPQTPLIGIDAFYTPVIVNPPVVPNIGDIVELRGDVNLRDSIPKNLNSTIIAGNRLTTLTKGTKVTIVNLHSNIFKENYTGIWAEVKVSSFSINNLC